MDMQQWAHAYIGVGWNVFPLLPKSKIPNGKLLWDTGFRLKDEKSGELKASWKPLQKIRVTEELVNEWWEREPNSNIALICGKISSVTVIDIDVANEEGWKDPEIVKRSICHPTLTSITGSGGMHLFCNYSPGVHNSTKSLHKQIDIKNDGGYVVLPPSIHDKTGNLYAFDPIFPFKPENVEQMTTFPLALKEKAMEVAERKMSSLDWKYILEGVKEKTDGRNNSAAKLIGKCLNALFVEFNGDPIILPFLWEFLEHWNKKNVPPLSDYELKSTFESIVTRVI